MGAALRRPDLTLYKGYVILEGSRDNTPYSERSDIVSEVLKNEAVISNELSETVSSTNSSAQALVDTEKDKSSSLENSPVLKALHSHIQKWYPETTKHNKLEINDMLETDMA